MQSPRTDLFDVDKLIEFRHWMHENAELSLVEFNTMAKIKEFGLKLGVPDEKFVRCGNTGWRVDISGTGKPKGSRRTIGVRSDHDALPIKEVNDLPYKSKTNAAHMCGHDGHTTMLLGGLSLLMSNLDQIPEDRTVRFIFQPAEEGQGGAELMIKDGVLEGIDEIYGCHNFPFNNTKSEILVADREMMADMLRVQITIIGTGGHGSSPEKCNNPIPIAARAYLEILRQINDYQKNVSPLIRFSLTSFNGGTTFNVIPGAVEITGSMRIFKKEDEVAICGIIRAVVEQVTQETNSKFNLEFIRKSSGAVVNTPEFAAHVRRYAKQHYGEDKVSDENLPIYASEDFADFLNLKPGCFFFRTIRNNADGVTLHNERYNFDDNVIDDTSRFWYRLIYERLNAD